MPCYVSLVKRHHRGIAPLQALLYALMMLPVMFPTKPTDIERLGIIVVVCFTIFRAANLTRPALDCSAPQINVQLVFG
jgi:hypothetical protein